MPYIGSFYYTPLIEKTTVSDNDLRSELARLIWLNHRFMHSQREYERDKAKGYVRGLIRAFEAVQEMRNAERRGKQRARAEVKRQRDQRRMDALWGASA